MNFVFSMFFFAVWPGGRRCAKCRDVHFFERYCDESIFTWKRLKTTMEKKNKQFRPMGKVWGEAWQGTWVWTFIFYFLVFPWFFSVWPKPREHTKKQKKTKSSDPWARSGLSTHKPKNQKNKKPKKQKNKKTKKQKKQKNQDCTPQREGSDAECWVLSFWFFWFFWFFVFLVFWFFGFLVFWFFGFLVFWFVCG